MEAPPPLPTEEDDIVEDAESQNRMRQFPCPACGARLEFKPSDGELNCPYCGHNEVIPHSDEEIEEQDFDAVLASLEQAQETEEVTVVNCNDCGASVDKPAGLTSFECAYCGAPIVAQEHCATRVKPQSLLPFKVERPKAQQLFKEWIGGLWFAPNNLKKRASVVETLKGMYVPYWTYDSRTVSHYTGQRGEHYYVTEHYTDSEGKSRTRQKRRTRWYSVSGVVYENFDDVLVLASTSMPRKLADELEPWDLKNLQPYSDEYLSGFSSQAYQIDLKEGFGRAKHIMDDAIRDEVRQDIGGDEQRIRTVRTNHRDVSFKHILLPTWLSTYRYNGEPYRFMVNGRTGEVQGQRPWSIIKIACAVLVILAVIGGVIYIANG